MDCSGFRQVLQMEMILFKISVLQKESSEIKVYINVLENDSFLVLDLNMNHDSFISWHSMAAATNFAINTSCKACINVSKCTQLYWNSMQYD